MIKLAIVISLIIININLLFSENVNLKEQAVASGATKNSAVYAADIDNDGYKDIVGNSYYKDDLYWWKNDGADQSTWTKYSIDQNFNNPQYIFVEDIDNDGKMDVLATGSVEAKLVAWWHNDGGSPIEWTREIIRENFDNAHGIYAKDINDDGNMDIIATAAKGSLICWWENDGNYPVNWTEHIIDNNAYGSQSVASYDIDSDGNNDVIATTDDEVIFYQNDGGKQPKWKTQVIDKGYFHWVDAADFNNDGFLDIVAAKYMTNNLIWYENSGADSITWTKHTISGYFQYGLTIYATDINNDGNIDIVGTAGSAQVAWFENSGGDNISWTKHSIKSNYRGAWGLFVADMDNDDDNDIIAGSNYYGNIKWFENGLNSTKIDNENFKTDKTFNLKQNYPNPFNPSTSINFTIHKAGQVQLKIYDINGQLVKTLLNERKSAGDHISKWNATNNADERVNSGIYFSKLTANNQNKTRRMVLLK